MIGSINQLQLQNLLHFITPSSVVLEKKISIQFKGLSGLVQQPIPHTCDCVIELPASHSSTLSVCGQLFSVTQRTAGRWTVFKLNQECHGFFKHLLHIFSIFNFGIVYNFVFFITYSCTGINGLEPECADLKSTVYIKSIHQLK